MEKLNLEALRDLYEACVTALNAMNGMYVGTGLHYKIGDVVRKLLEKAITKAEIK